MIKLMKKKVPFISHCGIGFSLILVILFLTVAARNRHGIDGNLDALSFVTPLLFVPLLVIVLRSGTPSCYQRLGKKKKSYPSKNLCILTVGGLLILVTFISGIILYYGW